MGSVALATTMTKLMEGDGKWKSGVGGENSVEGKGRFDSGERAFVDHGKH